MIRIHHEGGLRFVAEVRGHRIATDQKTSAGGQDSGPEPVELLVASLGTCMAITLSLFCQRRQIPCQGLAVELDYEMAERPHRVGAIHAKVHLPSGIPEQYRPVLNRVAEQCTVHNTLRHPPILSVEWVEGG